jgi:hypothetical protein
LGVTSLKCCDNYNAEKIFDRDQSPHFDMKLF